MTTVSPEVIEKWSEASRSAFSEFVSVPRKHIFFMPKGYAKLRAGYSQEWVTISEQQKNNFWSLYREINLIGGKYANENCGVSLRQQENR